MAKATILPFGPQHPVLPEPVHLDLVVDDERVVEAVPQIGFVHRGLERLTETRDYNQFIYVAERICGICAFGHSMGYAETIEKLMDVQIPERAEYIRVILHELSRVHSHILWMGLAADAFGAAHAFFMVGGTTSAVQSMILSACKAGQKLIEFDIEKIKKAGYSPVVAVLLTNSDDIEGYEVGVK